MYEHSPNGSGGYDANVLYRFQGSADDGLPSAGVIADAGGALYGTTRSSSGNNVGTAFQLSTNGSGGYTETTLYLFANSQDGAVSNSALVMDPSGDHYGTAYCGGIKDDGIVFHIQ